MTLAGDLRAFVAAWRKELRISRRYPAMLIGILFWPTLLPSVWVLMGRTYSGSDDPQALAAFAERAGTSEIAGFVFVGYAMYMWLSTLLWGPGTSLRMEQLRGSLEAVFLTPTTRLVPLFAPPIAHLPMTFLTLALMLATMRLLFGVAVPLDSALRALVVVAIAIPSMYAIGSLFAAFVLRIGETGPIVQLVRGTFVLACGITFPIAMLPDWAQVGAWLLPPTYVVSDMRQVLLRGLGLGDVGGDLVLLVLFAVAISVMAAVSFRIMERGARRTGMLGQY